MTKFLLALHVLAAIVAVGPVTVAASMFPPGARRAMAAPGDPQALSAVSLLHRICRVYAGVGLAVIVFGFATAASMGVLTDAWLITSIALTVAAAAVLIVLVLPGQETILADLEAAAETAPATVTAPVTAPATDLVTEPTQKPKVTAQLAMYTGIFNLLWATVTVLMIIRPGSTTGA
ncbi:protease [Streptomyces sp. NPDC088400]|uniref:protease n=1 Tax=Streptomyces sp. NPDC088400 TaxID=3365861 RepID=UPI00382B2E96